MLLLSPAAAVCVFIPDPYNVMKTSGADQIAISLLRCIFSQTLGFFSVHQCAAITMMQSAIIRFVSTEISKTSQCC